jgi:peptidoglycan/xylan/chitin deacetylase (PgdA/CDA1 family)
MRTTTIAILAGWLGFLPGTFAADTSGVPRPTFGDVPYGISVNSCTLPGKAVITFDDGPDSFTSDLLDVLSKNGVKVNSSKAVCSHSFSSQLTEALIGELFC